MSRTHAASAEDKKESRDHFWVDAGEAHKGDPECQLGGAHQC